MRDKAIEWRSIFTYVIATACASIGLGNIWRFPYVAGSNGGGAFVIIYLLCVFAIGIPLFVAEAVIGRYTRSNPATAFMNLVKGSKWWGGIGALTFITGFIIFSYYSVICGWVLHYVYLAASGSFDHITVGASKHLFEQLMADPGLMLFYDALIVFGSVIVVGLGIEQGLERVVMFIFPIFIVIMLILIGYAMYSGYFMQAVHFLFRPDFTQVNGHTILMACGQAFFSLGLGLGIILIFSAYLPKKASIIRSSTLVALADTGVALLAGLIIFPIVFAQGLSPSAGPGLIFEALPMAFSNMSAGTLFATLFFIMIAFAAFTSAFSFFEPAIVWMEHAFAWSRLRSSITYGVLLFVASIAPLLSFNVAKQVTIFGQGIFEFLDFIASNILLPFNGLMLALLVGWIVQKQIFIHELEARPGSYQVWHALVRYLAPVVILLIFLDAVGFI